MTGPLSTNPPAVIGRWAESYTGAKIPAEAMPPMPLFFSEDGFSGGACCPAHKFEESTARSAGTTTLAIPGREKIACLRTSRIHASKAERRRVANGTQFAAGFIRSRLQEQSGARRASRQETARGPWEESLRRRVLATCPGSPVWPKGNLSITPWPRGYGSGTCAPGLTTAR